jgi:hypothetical protein
MGEFVLLSKGPRVGVINDCLELSRQIQTVVEVGKTKQSKDKFSCHSYEPPALILGSAIMDRNVRMRPIRYWVSYKVCISLMCEVCKRGQSLISCFIRHLIAGVRLYQLLISKRAPFILVIEGKHSLPYTVPYKSKLRRITGIDAAQEEAAALAGGVCGHFEGAAPLGTYL